MVKQSDSAPLSGLIYPGLQVEKSKFGNFDFLTVYGLNKFIYNLTTFGGLFLSRTKPEMAHSGSKSEF